MYIATDGQTEYPVRIVHWWPHRQYAGRHPLTREELAYLHRRGTRFLTVVTCDHYLRTAQCCPKDAPSRKIGRDIALGRLAKAIEPEGLWLKRRP